MFLKLRSLLVYTVRDYIMFEDRAWAGAQLAKKLKKYKDSPIILALPRGGVVVGFEIAKALNVPFDVIISRKLGAPHNPEFGIGAISEEDSIILDKPTVASLGITKEEVQSIKDTQQIEMKRRIDLYRNGKPLPELTNKTVILVDDGLATGVTARAAIESIKKLKPKQIIFAAPVCSYETVQMIKSQISAVVCTITPHNLVAISLYYRNFPQITDEKVVEILQASRKTCEEKI